MIFACAWGGAVQAQDALESHYPEGNLASVVHWIQRTHDHRGLLYVVADKISATLYVIGADGYLIDQSPALFGKKWGDGVAPNQTPSGAFTLQREWTDEAGYGGDLLVFLNDEHADYAMHRTYLRYPQERRDERLRTETPEDNYISNGCINVPADFYDQYLANMDGHRLYVLPDSSSAFFFDRVPEN